MTVPRILVVGAETYTDAAMVERVVAHAFQALRDACGRNPILVTMFRTNAEHVAAFWWRWRALEIERLVPFKSKYQHINSLVSSAPDLMLVFGSDKVTKRAVEGARRGAVEIVEIAE